MSELEEEIEIEHGIMSNNSIEEEINDIKKKKKKINVAVMYNKV